MAHAQLTEQFDADMGQGPNEGGSTMVNLALVPMYREFGFGGLPEVFADIANKVLESYTYKFRISLEAGICGINGHTMYINEGLLNHLKNQRDVLSAVLTMTPRTRRMYPGATKETEDLELQTRALKSYLGHGVVNIWELILLRELGNALSGHVNTQESQQWNENAVECDKEIGRNLPDGGGSGFEPALDTSKKTQGVVTVGDEGRSEGRLKQVQITYPTASDLFYDMWAEMRDSSYTKRDGVVVDTSYRDPQGSTKSGLFTLLNSLDKVEPRVKNNVMTWQPSPGMAIAACFESKNPKAPVTIKVPLRLVYEAIASKDEGFREAWGIARRITHGEYYRLTWRLQQKIIRMCQVAKGQWELLDIDPEQKGFMTLKCWGRMVDGWRELLGLPLTKPTESADRIEKVRPPKVKDTCEIRCGCGEKHMPDEPCMGWQCRVYRGELVKGADGTLRPAAG